MQPLIFDTSPLSQFARIERLDVLKAVVGERHRRQRCSAHRLGTEAGISCTRTLALLCDGIREGLLTIEEVSDLADELIATDYRLPFGPGGFTIWAKNNDLVPD